MRLWDGPVDIHAIFLLLRQQRSTSCGVFSGQSIGTHLGYPFQLLHLFLLTKVGSITFFAPSFTVIFIADGKEIDKEMNPSYQQRSEESTTFSEEWLSS